MRLYIKQPLIIQNNLNLTGGFRQWRRGLTLMELIGILAVIVILVGTITPAIIKRIVESKRTAEGNDLYTIAETLKAEILRKRAIPSANNWAEFLSEALQKPPSEIHKSRRIMVVDPQINIGSGSLPYTQSTNGTTLPINARIMFLSNLSLNTNNPAIPADIASDPVKFQQVWDTPDRAVPPGWPSSWNNKGENLKIQRLELTSLFRRLSIQVTYGTYAWISIDGSPPFPVTNSHRFYFYGTDIGLYSIGGTNLFHREPLFDDIVYIFNGRYWTTDPEDAKDPYSDQGQQNSIAQTVNQFLTAITNPNAKFGTSQEYLVNDLYYFMYLYSRWASDNFTNYGSLNMEQLIEYQALLDLANRAQGRIQTEAGNLIWY
jgi:hypothetical protein